MNKQERPTSLKIAKITNEAENIKSFYFNHDLASQPGQFLMVWLPGVDEKPITIASNTNDQFSITVCAVGPFSKAVHQLKEGDMLGFRGPYGLKFNFKDTKRICCVAGGYGAATLAYLAETAKAQGIEVDFIIGARTENLLLFKERLASKGINYHAATDDGSCGHNGFCTELLKTQIRDNKPDKVFTVGPEIMMKVVTGICTESDIPFEVSLERYMKCGFGICGQCCVDDTGERVCMEGTVFDQDRIKRVKEFGKYHRDATGKIVR